MDYANAEKKSDFTTAVKQDAKKTEVSGFKAFTQFLDKWASIHPPVLKELR